MAFFVDLAERGYLPDGLVRFGIRNLLSQRLKLRDQGSDEANEQSVRDWVAELERSPIAVNTVDANEQHYEVPAEFFQKILGRRLKYSSCYYESSDSTLDEAEETMLRLTAERAGIENGMAVLDLGCGWGSFSLWLAENFPKCRVVSVSNSNSQREHIERRAAAKGLTNLRVITRDINEFEAPLQFDRIVSIEMLEHVRNYGELFRRAAGWLAEDGKMFVHIFCHHRFAYPYDETEDDANSWMTKYFFRGGQMPSENLFGYFPEDMTVEQKWIVNGTHYERTLNDWLKRLDVHRKGILPLFEQTYGSPKAARMWLQRWRIFLMACAELFGYARGEEWYVTHYLLYPVKNRSTQDENEELETPVTEGVVV